MLHRTRFLFSGLVVVFLVWCGAAGSWAGSLSAAFSPIATGSNVDLTVSGKLDWVHWGLYTEGSVDRKACVTPQISNFSLVSTDAPDCLVCFLTDYQYGDNDNGYTWHDGALFRSVTNTTTGVWAYSYPSAITSGFQLTVPADTSQKTLQVFVGAYAAEGQLTASLSDGSAGPLTIPPGQTVNNLSNGPGGVFALTYAANSPGQTLTVTWTVLRSYGGVLVNPPNVTLQAATLTAPGADNPPFAVITDPPNNAAFAAPATITIQADAEDFDTGGAVTNVAFFAGTTKLGQATHSPFSFTWPSVPRGHYILTAIAADNAGVMSCGQPTEIFVYGTGGGQTNALASPPASSVDLTSEGTADWTHWGLITNTSFDYKALVTRKISNFTALGTNEVQNYGDNFTGFSWSDGTPTPATNGTTTGVYITGLTNGFQLTAPADATPRRLNVYVGGYGGQGEFQAYLSDLSAPPYSDSTTISNVYNTTAAQYTIDYTAASTNQQLIVVVRSESLFDMTYGNVNLQAATLEGGPPEPLPVQLVNAMMVGSGFVFSFLTQPNFNYAVQSVDALSSTNWTTLATLPGTGGMLSVTNQNPGAGPKFYRVLTQ